MEVNGQLLNMVALPPGHRIRIGRWLDQTAELEALEKKKKKYCPAGNRTAIPRSSGPKLSHSTVYSKHGKLNRPK